MNQPNLATGKTVAGLPATISSGARMRKAGLDVIDGSETVKERLFWEGVYRALQMLSSSIRRIKLGKDQEKCSHCGR